MLQPCVFTRVGRKKGFQLVFSAAWRCDCLQSSGKLHKCCLERICKGISVGRTNSRHIFTLFCAKIVPVPDSEIEKHLWSFLTLLLYLLTMVLRHCLSMRNALHLLKIPPASLLAILNCWAPQRDCAHALTCTGNVVGSRRCCGGDATGRHFL